VVLDYNVTIKELIDKVRQLEKDRNVRKKEDFLSSIITRYLSGEKKEFLTCKLIHDEQIANVTFCIHGHTACYYLVGALDKNVKAKNAGAICLHDSIVRAQEKGIKVFDFEGSSIPAIESFFRSFGGELTHYFNIRKCPPILKRFLK
jgi:lipid II:glycine glycyltransferase (peptidoglycan interpeptide bridge formation enzyme)